MDEDVLDNGISHEYRRIAVTKSLPANCVQKREFQRDHSDEVFPVRVRKLVSSKGVEHVDVLLTSRGRYAFDCVGPGSVRFQGRQSCWVKPASGEVGLAPAFFVEMAQICEAEE